MRWIILALMPVPALADAVVTTRPIPARTVLAAADVTVVDADIPDVVPDVAAVIGRETRVALFAGRPLRAADLTSPALVDRNQIVALRFASGMVEIVTEGRALGRAAEGEVISVMNLASRSTVRGRVLADGSVAVAGGME